MSSAMASPASTSPPTVLSRNSTPSISSLSSRYARSGSTCSYLVAFCVFGSSICPSICPAMVRQWMAARLFLMTTEPKSMTGWMGGRSGSCPFFSSSCDGFVSLLMAKSSRKSFPVGFAERPKSIPFVPSEIRASNRESL